MTWMDLHVYYCDFTNATYNLQVQYLNNIQTNQLLNLTTHTKIDPEAGSAWETPIGQYTPSVCFPDLAALDAISLYRSLCPYLAGQINHNLESVGWSDNSTVAFIPGLVYYPNASSIYRYSEPTLPRTDMGTLLEELSHNISISLLSEPRLQVVGSTSTTCSISATPSVWRYRPLALVLAYILAVSAMITALAIGFHAMLASGVARHLSFSSIVRTTRSESLNVLSTEPEWAGLPLSPSAGRLRVRFGETGVERLGQGASRRIGFRLEGVGMET